MQNQSIAMPKIFGTASQKGGVGKTTCTSHTALYLASLGKKVLVIDADQLASTTDTLVGKDAHTYELDGKEHVYGELFTLIMDKVGARKMHPDEVILQTRWENLDLMPTWSGLQNLKGATTALATEEYAILDIIEDIIKLNRYDYILYDTAPAGTVLEKSIFATCHYIIPVTNCKAYSEVGYSLLVNILDELEHRKRIKVQIPFFVISTFNQSFKQDVETRNILESLKQKGHFRELFCVPTDQGINKIITGGSNGFDTPCKISPVYKSIAEYIIKEL